MMLQKLTSPQLFFWNWKNLPLNSVELLSPYLSLSEQKILAAYKSPKRKIEFAASRFLLRNVFQLFSDTSAPDTIDKDPHGKPRPIHGLHFSLSHSNAGTVLGASSLGPIGVDIEGTAKSRDFLGIAKEYATTREYNNLLALKEPQRSRFFYKLWTLKEAYGKATGLGLQEDLKALDFNFEKNLVSHAQQDQFLFFESASVENHHISLCQFQKSATKTIWNSGNFNLNKKKFSWKPMDVSTKQSFTKS